MKIFNGTNNHNKIKKNSSIKNFPLFLSQFTYLIILGIISVFGLIFPTYHKSVTYQSKSNYRAWNSSSDPLIFTHITDIHLTNFKEKDKFESLFKAAKLLNASFYLLSGDLVDNYRKKNFPKIGKQNEKDWKLYKDLLDSKLSNETVLDVAGNHDMFGVISPLNNKFGFLDCSFSFNRNNTKKMRDFWIKTVSIKGMKFILFNPFIFPIVHPPYGFYPHTKKKILDLLEKKIDEIGPCNILTHFPIDFFWGQESSNGKTVGKMMRSNKIQYIFSGHTHPSDFNVIHHEHGGLEFIGTSARVTNTFGLVTIDNGRLVYNNVEFKKNAFTKCFMSHPIPLNQIGEPQIFNEKNTEIRVISYDEDIHNDFLVTGDFHGILIYQRNLENGAKLYSMPLNISENGKYEIKVLGPNCEIKRKFYIGETYNNKKEIKVIYKACFYLILSSSGAFSIILFIIVLPIKLIDFSFVDDWICGLNEEKCYWIQVIFLSPLILNYRININVHIIFRFILLFLLFYTIILPFHFFEPIEGHIGYSFLCYIYINDNVLFEEWAIFFNLFYYWGVISPSAIVLSSFRFHHSCVFYFNLIFLYITFIGICIVNFRWAGESVKTGLLFIHPCFIIIPIILNILIYISLFKYKELNQNNHNNENQSIIITSLNKINKSSNGKEESQDKMSFSTVLKKKN